MTPIANPQKGEKKIETSPLINFPNFETLSQKYTMNNNGAQILRDMLNNRQEKPSQKSPKILEKS